MKFELKIEYLEWYVYFDGAYIDTRFVSTDEDFKKFFQVKNEKITAILVIVHYEDDIEVMYRWTKKKGWAEPRKIDSEIRSVMGDVYPTRQFRFGYPDVDIKSKH